MSKTCQTHNREAWVYDLSLNQAICERCALLDPLYQGHHFEQVDSLGHYFEDLVRSFSERLASLQIVQEEGNIIYLKIKEISEEKLSQDVAAINNIYEQKLKEIERERVVKIKEKERQVKEIMEQSTKSIKIIIQQEYLRLLDAKQTIKELYAQGNYKELSQMLCTPSLLNRVAQIQKDLQMINLEFNNNLTFIAPKQTAQYFTLTKKQFNNDEVLLEDIEDEYICMFDYLGDSCLSEKSYCDTEISFAALPCIEALCKSQKESPTTRTSLNESVVRAEKPLNCLKVYNKSEIKNIYIKNNIRQISMVELRLNNQEAIQAIKKCSLNSFVYKIDISDNSITQKLVTQLKREKIHSKYLKRIVAKGMKVDARELKKEGITVNISQDGNSSITIGDITVEY